MYGYMRSTLSSETPNQNRETLSQKSTTKQSITQRRNQPVFKSRRHKKPGFFQRLRRSKALVDNKNDEKTIDHIFDSNQITDLNTSRNSYLSTDPVDDYVDEICGSSSNSVESNEEDDKVPDQLIKPSSINSSFQSFFSPSYCNYSLSTGKSFESLNTSTANGSTWTVNIVNELPRTTLKDVLKDVSLEKRRRLTITLDGTQGSLVGTHNNIYGTQGGLAGTHSNIYGTQGSLISTNIYSTQSKLDDTRISTDGRLDGPLNFVMPKIERRHSMARSARRSDFASLRQLDSKMTGKCAKDTVKKLTVRAKKDSEADTVHNNLNDVSNDQNVKTYDSTEQNELHYDVTLDITHDYSSSDETFNNETIPSPIPSEYNKDFEANITKEDVTLSNNTDSTVPEEIYKPHIVLRPKKVKDQLIQQINNIYQRYSMKRKESMVDFEDTIRHSLYDIQYTSINADFCRTVEEKESSDIVVGGVAKERVGLYVIKNDNDYRYDTEGIVKKATYNSITKNINYKAQVVQDDFIFTKDTTLSHDSVVTTTVNLASTITDHQQYSENSTVFEVKISEEHQNSFYTWNETSQSSDILSITSAEVELNNETDEINIKNKHTQKGKDSEIVIFEPTTEGVTHSVATVNCSFDRTLCEASCDNAFDAPTSNFVSVALPEIQQEEMAYSEQYLDCHFVKNKRQTYGSKSQHIEEENYDHTSQTDDVTTCYVQKIIPESIQEACILNVCSVDILFTKESDVNNSNCFTLPMSSIKDPLNLSLTMLTCDLISIPSQAGLINRTSIALPDILLQKASFSVADVTLDLSNLENNEVVHAVITDQVKDRLEYNETAMCHNYDKAAHSPIGETRKCACACFKTTVTQSTAYSETCCCVDMRHEDDVKVVDNSDDETWSCKINEKIQKSCMASPAGAPVLCGTKDSVQDKGLANGNILKNDDVCNLLNDQYLCNDNVPSINFSIVDRAQKELSVDIQDTSFCHDTPSVDTFLHSNAPKKLAQFSPLIIETSTKVTKPSLDKESAVPLLRSPIIPSLSLPTPTQQFSPAFERPHQEVEATFIAQESHKALDALTVSNVEQEFSCNGKIKRAATCSIFKQKDNNSEKSSLSIIDLPVKVSRDEIKESATMVHQLNVKENESYSETNNDINIEKNNITDAYCIASLNDIIISEEEFSVTQQEQLLIKEEEDGFASLNLSDQNKEKDVFTVTAIAVDLASDDRVENCNATLKITAEEQEEYSEIVCQHLGLVNKEQNKEELVEATVHTTEFDEVKLAISWIDCVFAQSYANYNAQHLVSQVAQQTEEFAVTSAYFSFDKNGSNSSIGHIYDGITKNGEVLSIKCDSNENKDLVENYIHVNTCENEHHFTTLHKALTVPSISPSTNSTSNTISEVPDDPTIEFNDDALLKYGEMIMLPSDHNKVTAGFELGGNAGSEGTSRAKQDNIDDRDVIIQKLLKDIVDKVVQTHLEQFEKRFGYQNKSSPAKLNLMGWFDNSDLVQEQIAEVEFQHTIKFGNKLAMLSDDNEIPISDDEYENPSMDDSTATITSNASKLVLNSTAEEKNGTEPAEINGKENNGTSSNGVNGLSEPLGLGGSNTSTPIEHAPSNGGRPDESDEQAVDEEAAVFKDANITVSIRAYEKRSEGFNAYIVYKIETKVNGIPNYTKSMNEVWRRFSDFLGLRDKLAEKYQHKGVAIPLAPEKSIAALTKTKLNTTNDEGYTTDVAEKRARLLERFLRRLVRSPRLVVDCDLVDFLSLDANLPKASFTAALSTKSMQKIFKSVGDALNKIAYPMDENDRWFEQMHGNVEELDDMLVRLYSIVDQLGSYRKELSQSSDSLSKSLSMIASCEENTALARTLSKLAETKENLSVVQRHEADTDSQILAESIQEHLHMTQVLKELFFERVKAWQNWQTLRQNLAKKRELKARFDLAGRPDRANVAKAEVEDCEQKVDKMEQEFQEMSKTIRREYIRLCKERRTDLKTAFVSYLEALIESEQHTLEHWQKFAPEVQSII